VVILTDPYGRILGTNFHTRFFFLKQYTSQVHDYIHIYIKIIMFPEGKVRLVRRADNLTTICEPIV
jgi:hypothetical protein